MGLIEVKLCCEIIRKILPTGCVERQTAGIVLTQRPKIIIFAHPPQERLVAPTHVKFDTGEVRGSAWPCEISRQSVHGVYRRPQKLS